MAQSNGVGSSVMNHRDLKFMMFPVNHRYRTLELSCPCLYHDIDSNPRSLNARTVSFRDGAVICKEDPFFSKSAVVTGEKFKPGE